VHDLQRPGRALIYLKLAFPSACGTRSCGDRQGGAGFAGIQFLIDNTCIVRIGVR